MKNLIYLCISVFIITLGASCRNKCCLAPDTSAYVYAQKNGADWNASSYAGNYQDTLTMIASYKEEHLGFRIKFIGIGQYTLTGQQAFFYNTVGQDVRVSNYIASTLAPSVVNVTYYDKASGNISGTFSMNLTKTYDNPTSTYPNTLTFLNGKFSAVVSGTR